MKARSAPARSFRPNSLAFAPALLALAAPSPPTAGAGVFVVDDDGGPGADFTSLAAAVDAAADGDTILVHPGSYAPFVVLGKGVSIVSTTPGAAHVAGGSVRQVPTGSTVLLRGLHIESSTEEGLSVLGCDGLVSIEACVARGADGVGFFTDPLYHPRGYAGIRTQGSLVGLSDCAAIGGDGANYVLLQSTWDEGGPGLAIQGGAAVIHGGSFQGGHGGSVWDFDSAYPGADGADGITVENATVYVAGAGLVGGHGGTGGQDGLLGGGYICGDGGDGGSGIGHDGGALVDVTVLDIHATPGAGGLGDLGYGGCPSGAPGVAVDVPPGQVTVIDETAVGLAIAGPVAETGALSLSIVGEPGGLCVLGVGAAPAYVSHPLFAGPLLVDPATALAVPIGALPGGALNLSIPLSVDVPAGAVLELRAQAVVVSPTSGAIVPGTAASVIVLDSAL